MNKTKRGMAGLFPVMLVFFTMGFVDLVGIATNYMKADFGLSDTVANSFSAMVFLWFLLCSIPTSLLMGRIGRKRTVEVSLVLTLVGLVIPLLTYSRLTMVFAFILIGLGNTVMQVSLNPLLASLVDNRRLPSFLTLGQFVKAIASFLAPLAATYAAVCYGDWKWLFVGFALVNLVALAYLAVTPMKETAQGRTSSFGECLELLNDKTVVLLFIGILVHVGIDVGVNMTAPKLLQEKLDMSLAEAGTAASVYFLFRTVGCLSGSFILARFDLSHFFVLSAALIAFGLVGLYLPLDMIAVYASVGLIGYGNSNIFSIILSNALLYKPDHGNGMSGLMVMGIFGGAVFPLLMGLASDLTGGQTGAVTVLVFCVLYLFFLAAWLIHIRKNTADNC